jgi:hypothetical protein
MAFTIGLIAFVLSTQVGRASLQEDSGGSIQELRERIGKLETQVASLQKQTNALESRQMLAIPGPQLPPGIQMPPGSKQYEFNGQKYWFVPLRPDSISPKRH